MCDHSWPAGAHEALARRLGDQFARGTVERPLTRCSFGGTPSSPGSAAGSAGAQRVSVCGRRPGAYEWLERAIRPPEAVDTLWNFVGRAGDPCRSTERVSTWTRVTFRFCSVYKRVPASDVPLGLAATPRLGVCLCVSFQRYPLIFTRCAARRGRERPDHAVYRAFYVSVAVVTISIPHTDSSCPLAGGLVGCSMSATCSNLPSTRSGTECLVVVPRRRHTVR